MTDLQEFALDKIKMLKNSHNLRTLSENERGEYPYIYRDGKKLLSFACNDYLGLSNHPEVKKAAIEAIKKYGAGAGASRLISGNNILYSELEERLAELKGTESALVFGSGYLANIGIIPALVGKSDLIIADKLVHACIIDGIKLSGARLLRFQHNDLSSLERLIRKHRKDYENCLIVTENVFSMDGDIAPLEDILDIAEESDCWVLSDDAHGSFTKRITPRSFFLQIGTLSKSIGSYGGYVCGSSKVIKYLKNSARSLLFSTALPPSVIASAVKSLQLIAKDQSITSIPVEKAISFTAMANIKKAESAIVPVVIGDNAKALSIANKLKEYGFYVPAIRPPTVPAGTARLRFSFSALHKDKDIEDLAKILKKERVV